MDYHRRRQRMVARIAEGGVTDPAVLRVLGEIPRHLFVEEALREKAYGTHALPIGFRQTISQPEIVARMTELLAIQSGDRVLEVGTGSGYQAAVLARLAAEVLSLERIPQLARRAEEVLHHLGLRNVRVQVADGSIGLGEGAMFQGILVAAAAPAVPEPLLRHLADGGRMVVPVGRERAQSLIRIIRQGEEFLHQDHGPCTFVKLIGRSRWANLPEESI
jgi:protein-L-isoaspartate(D-aspartate) O-methyltransferase